MYERVVAWLISFISTRFRHTVAVGQISIGTTPAQVLARNPARFGAVITNGGSGNIYVGPPENTAAANGHIIPGGGSLSLVGAAEIWAVSDSSGPYAVSFLIELGE